MSRPRPRIGAALLPAALLLSGCSLGPLENEWARIEAERLREPPTIVDWFPGLGPHGVSPEVRPVAVFNRPLWPETAEADFERDHLSEEVAEAARSLTITEMWPWGQLPHRLQGATGAWSDVIRWRPDRLAEGGHFEAGFGTRWRFGDPTSELFSTDHSGDPVFELADLSVEAFGGSQSEADLLDAVFRAGVYPTWLLQLRGLRGPDSLPVEISIDLAAGRPDPEDPDRRLIHQDYGFGAAFRDVHVSEDGEIDHQQGSLLLGLWSGPEVHLIRLRDVALVGRVTFTGEGEPRLEDVTISGSVGARWLLRLAEISQDWRNVIGSCDPDVDTDGNGVNDAASIGLASQPRSIGPDAWDWD